jgi:hypothetical protein
MSTDTQQATPATPNLTIGDLVLTAQIIQVGAIRGIFKAEELKNVGDFYDRLVNFLEASGAITRPGAKAETTTEQASAETPTESKENS